MDELNPSGEKERRIVPAATLIEYRALLARWRAADGTAKSSDLSEAIRRQAAEDVAAISEALRQSPFDLDADAEGNLVPPNIKDVPANLVVDGLDEAGNFAGDGERAPFVIFDVNRQENIAGPFAARDLADQHRQEIIAGYLPRLDAAALSLALVAEEERDLKCEQAWLVEIRLKDWEPSLADGSRVVAYEEVLASGEMAARHAGFDQFAARCKYDPALRRKMQRVGLTEHNCCAPDAVQIEVDLTGERPRG